MTKAIECKVEAVGSGYRVLVPHPTIKDVSARFYFHGDGELWNEAIPATDFGMTREDMLVIALDASREHRQQLVAA